VLLSRLLKWIVKTAPGFPGYLAGYGISLDDDCNIVGLDSVRARYRRGRGGRGGGGGVGGGGIGGWLTGLIIVLFLAYIAMTMIGTFEPLIGNISYAGGGVGRTIFSIVQQWVIPLALIGLLVYVIMTFLGKRLGRQ